MKKFILSILMLCVITSFTACKKKTAEAEPTDHEAEGSVQVEETLEIELPEGAEGEIAPD